MSGNEDRAGEMIPVHVVSMPTPKRKIFRTVYKTLTITQANFGTELLPASDCRVMAWVKALDDDLIVGGLKSDVEKGEGTTLAKALTAPWPVQDSTPVWVAAPALAGATSRIAVTDTYWTYE
jgi:hypothetical protein